MGILQNLRKTKALLKSKGMAATYRKIVCSLRGKLQKRNYQKFIKREKLTAEKRRNYLNQIAGFSHKPLISIILPVYDIDEKWLRLCIESVLKQIYENWELCIADDKSPRPHIKKILEEYAGKDERIKIVFREKNGHISAASNSALEIATGEFCVLLDHDDELSEDALFFVVKELNDFPETAFIYSDEDLIDEKGKRFEPKFKPDFSRDLMYSLNLITHLSAYRTDFLRKIGGFRIGLEGSQDYDLALRVLEEIDEKQIRHIPKILYHWRAIRGSVAFSPDEKPYAHERARQAIREHLTRMGKSAKVSRTFYNLHRVSYQLPEKEPKITLILSASADFFQSQELIEKATAYKNFEIIENQSENAENLNRTAAQASGEILCFLNGNLKPLTSDWLKELVSFAVQTEIGVVGAKILEEDETVFSNGLIIGGKSLVRFAHSGHLREVGGNFCRNVLISNFSAVSILCLVVRRRLFNEIGGFDEKNFSETFFDADFCLKLREKNMRNLITPYAELKQTEKFDFQLKPSVEEKNLFKQKWCETNKNDPFYNPNLSESGDAFLIKI
jgi:glycosyltransferase involved in cell wall biosynthesis